MYHFSLVGFRVTDACIFFLELKYTQPLQDKKSKKERIKEL